MAARTAWRGAIEFAGTTINLRFYPRRKSRGSDSFKTLGPDEKPIRSVYLERSTGRELDRTSETHRGVQLAPDDIKPLDQKAEAALEGLEKDRVVSPVRLCPVSTVPLELALQSYYVYPDKDVAGAEIPANQLWNGLLASQHAYVATLAMRAGSRDAVLVIYARGDGLYAATLPFGAEIHPPAEAPFQEVDRKVQKTFAAFVEAGVIPVGEFDPDEPTSRWAEVKELAVKLAMGKPVKKPAAKAKAKPTDLMASLEGAIAELKGEPAKPKRSRKKVAA